MEMNYTGEEDDGKKWPRIVIVVVAKLVSLYKMIYKDIFLILQMKLQQRFGLRLLYNITLLLY